MRIRAFTLNNGKQHSPVAFISSNKWNWRPLNSPVCDQSDFSAAAQADITVVVNYAGMLNGRCSNIPRRLWHNKCTTQSSGIAKTLNKTIRLLRKVISIFRARTYKLIV